MSRMSLEYEWSDEKDRWEGMLITEGRKGFPFYISAELPSRVYLGWWKQTLEDYNEWLESE